MGASLLDAEDYYTNLTLKYREKLDKIKEKAEKENIGLAFVCFKNKDCTLDAIEQLDVIKQRMIGKQFAELVGIQNWEAEKAIPMSDIIWQNLNKSAQRPFLVKLIENCGPFLLSVVFVGALAITDVYLTKVVGGFIGYMALYIFPLLLAAYNFYFFPLLLFKILKRQRPERKSEKESRFVSRNTLYIILNSIFVPFLFLSFAHYSFADIKREELNDIAYPKTPFWFPDQDKNPWAEPFLNLEYPTNSQGQVTTPTDDSFWRAPVDTQN